MPILTLIWRYQNQMETPEEIKQLLRLTEGKTLDQLFEMDRVMGEELDKKFNNQ